MKYPQGSKLAPSQSAKLLKFFGYTVVATLAVLIAVEILLRLLGS